MVWFNITDTSEYHSNIFPRRNSSIDKPNEKEVLVLPLQTKNKQIIQAQPNAGLLCQMILYHIKEHL